MVPISNLKAFVVWFGQKNREAFNGPQKENLKISKAYNFELYFLNLRYISTICDTLVDIRLFFCVDKDS